MDREGGKRRFLVVSEVWMATFWPTPHFKGRENKKTKQKQPWDLIRGDLNFCFGSTHIAGSSGWTRCRGARVNVKLKPAVTSQTNENVLHVTGLSEPPGTPCYSCVNRGTGGQRILSSSHQKNSCMLTPRVGIEPGPTTCQGDLLTSTHQWRRKTDYCTGNLGHVRHVIVCSCECRSKLGNKSVNVCLILPEIPHYRI